MLEFGNIENVKLSDVYANKFYQMRLDGLNKAHLAGLVATLEDGGKIKEPIMLVRVQGIVERLYLADGFHRLEAHKKAARRVIRARIADGTLEELLAYAESTNLQHGLKLSYKDRRRILEQRLARHYMETLDDGQQVEWIKLSVGFLASLLGVPSSTVGAWVRDYVGQADLPADSRSTVYGRDGRAYNVENVVASNAERMSDTAVTDSDEDTPPSPFKHGEESGSGESTDADLTGQNEGQASSQVESDGLSDFEREVLQAFTEYFESQDDAWANVRKVFPSGTPDFEHKQKTLRELASRGVLIRNTVRDAVRPVSKFEENRPRITEPVDGSTAEPTRPNEPVNASQESTEAVADKRADVTPSNGTPEENDAILHRAKLEKAAFGVLDAIQPYLQMRGIAQLHHLEPGVLLATQQVLEDVRQDLQRALAHTEELDSKIRIMMATGKDYAEVSPDEKLRILSGWGGMNDEDVDVIKESYPLDYDKLVVVPDDAAGYRQKRLLTIRSYMQEIFGDDGIVEAAEWLNSKIRGMTVGVKQAAHELNETELGRVLTIILNELGDRLYHPGDDDGPSGEEESRDTTPFDSNSKIDKARLRSKMRDTATRKWGAMRRNTQIGITGGNNGNKPKVEFLTFAIGQDRRLTATSKKVAMIDVVPDENIWYVCDEHGTPFGYSQLNKEPGITNLKKYVAMDSLIDIRELGVEIVAMVGAALDKTAICDEILRLEITKSAEVTA